MPNLSENEIFDCLMTNFRLAGENCIILSDMKGKGKHYTELRKQLKLIEGCCTQISRLRLDYRWLPIGNQIGKAIDLSGSWIRKYRYKDDKFLYELFMGLAEFMAFGYSFTKSLKDEKTNTSNPILPEYMDTSTPRSQSSTSMRISHGGIIIPDGCSV